ncbi:MAG: prolipoprotein diacylglyceryl transferase [Actinomycetota bacterium]
MILGAAVRFGSDPLAWEILSRIHVGPVAISPHGIGIAAGYLLGAQVLARRARERGGPSEADIWNALFYALIGAIVGARLGYVLGHIPEVTDGGGDPLGVLRVWEGGISLLGGITGGILGALPYMRKRRMGFWRSLDLTAPGLALGIVVGRVGDLIIGDHLGTPTKLPWAWLCLGEAGGAEPVPARVYRAALAQGDPPSLGCFDLPLHQTALYDFVSTLVLLGVLLWLGRRRHGTGFLTLTFALWYGAMRVFTDFLRVDRRYLGLTGSQWLALTVVVVSAALLARYRGAPPRWADPPPDDDGYATTESDGPPPERGETDRNTHSA